MNTFILFLLLFSSALSVVADQPPCCEFLKNKKQTCEECTTGSQIKPFETVLVGEIKPVKKEKLKISCYTTEDWTKDKKLITCYMNKEN